MKYPLLAAISLAAAPLAYAQESAPIQFNTVELGYLHSEATNSDGDGFAINLSYSFLDHYFATASYNTRTLDAESGSASADFDFISAGVGGKYALTESGKYVVYGGLTYEMLDIAGSGAGGGGTDNGGGEEPTDEGGEGPTGTPLDILLCALLFDCESGAQTKSFNAATGTGDTSGYGAHVGIRAEVYPNVEVGASYQYRMYDDKILLSQNPDDVEQILGLAAGYRLGSWAAVLSYNSYDTLDLDEYQLAVRWEFGRE